MNRVEIENWIADDPDPKTAAELQALLDANDEVALDKLFNGFLTFGTAGLRGPIAPGPSGMNRAVVGRTAAAIAQYMKQRNLNSVVIGRDASLSPCLHTSFLVAATCVSDWPNQWCQA